MQEAWQKTISSSTRNYEEMQTKNTVKQPCCFFDETVVSIEFSLPNVIAEVQNSGGGNAHKLQTRPVNAHLLHPIFSW